MWTSVAPRVGFLKKCMFWQRPSGGAAQQGEGGAQAARRAHRGQEGGVAADVRARGRGRRHRQEVSRPRHMIQ
jgi:hypothetical protein